MNYEVSIMQYMINEECIGPENAMTIEHLLELLNAEGLDDQTAIEESLAFLIHNGDISLAANDNDSAKAFWLR